MLRVKLLVGMEPDLVGAVNAEVEPCSPWVPELVGAVDEEVEPWVPKLVEAANA